MLGEVTEVFLKDENPNDIYKIKVSFKRSVGSASTEFAYPLNPYIKSVPIIGEQVYLITGMGSKSRGAFSGGYEYYYISPTFLQRTINNNPLPKTIINTARTFNTNVYTQQLIPDVSSPDNNDGFGKGFSQINDLSQLQPYLGDTIFEGRFGQSIRFGYTPKESDAKRLPTWNSSNPNKPITIIRNTQNSTNLKGYDIFVLEDINKDDSSIWLTSTQKIAINPANRTSVSNISEFSGPQIIINSDRLIFNSKSDSIILSGKNNIYMSTSKYKADVNELISIIETLFTTVELINQTMNVLTTAYSAIPIVQSPAIAANSTLNSTVLPKITELKTKFTKIKNV